LISASKPAPIWSATSENAASACSKAVRASGVSCDPTRIPVPTTVSEPRSAIVTTAG